MPGKLLLITILFLSACYQPAATKLDSSDYIEIGCRLYGDFGGFARIYDTDLVQERRIVSLLEPDTVDNSYTMANSYDVLDALLRNRLSQLPNWTYKGDGSAGGGNYITYKSAGEVHQIGNFYEVSSGEKDPIGDWVIKTRSEMFKSFPKLKEHIDINC